MPSDNDDYRDKVKTLFLEAIELPVAARESYVSERCGDDDAMRQQVLALLRADASEDKFGEIVGKAAQSMLGRPAEQQLDRRIGNYRLISVLGEGGMGAVYLAERVDQQFRQQVAIKILKSFSPSHELISRFRTERQILANLDHPNIARLLDGGELDDGLPYLVMEYVEGEQITEYCFRNRLSVRARLQLFQRVCDAVEHAHRNLVIHRDIKPANILIDKNGEPRLLDFGVAKLFDNPSQLATVTELRAMTPRYASPEQFRGEPLSISTDVYSLSVLLYELLVGVGPYDEHTNDAVALHAAICNGEFDRPSTAARRTNTGSTIDSRVHVKKLHGDLDNIVLMGLRVEPARRYTSVRELSNDIESYLKHKPVIARPDTLTYRATKFMQRRRGALLAAAGVTTLVLIMSVLFVDRIITERNVAQAARDQAEQVTTFLADLLRGSDRFESGGEEVTLRDVLDDGAARIQTQLADQPIERARLMEIIAQTYNSLSLNEKAAALSRQALEIRLRELGESHADTQASMRNVGHFGRIAGNDVEESIALLTKARDLQIQTLGTGSHEVASTRNALGQALRYKGDQTGSLEEFTLAYDVLVNLPDDHPDHRFEPFLLNQIGSVHGSLNNSSAATDYYRQSLTALEAQDLPDHPLHGALLSNIGTNLRKDGQLDEALGYLERAVAHTYRILGEESEDYEVQLSSLGRLLGQLGRFEEANEALDGARAVARKLYGEDHPYYAWHIVNLARLRQLENRHTDALSLLNEAIPIYRETYGEYHPFLAAAEVGYSETNLELGLPEIAANQVRETLDRMHEDGDHERHIEALGRGLLGRALGELGRDEEAKKLLTGALIDLRELFGDEHQLTAQVARYLVDFLDARGAGSEADPFRQLTAPFDKFREPPE